MIDFSVSVQVGGVALERPLFFTASKAIAFLGQRRTADRFAYGKDSAGGKVVLGFALAGGPVTLTEAGIWALGEEKGAGDGD